MQSHQGWLYTCQSCLYPYPNKRSLYAHLSNSNFCTEAIESMHYPIRSNTKIHDQTLSPINFNTKAKTDDNTQSSDEIQIYDNESSDSSEDTKNSTKMHDSNIIEPYHFSNNEFQEIKLLKLLNELGTPLYAYKLIMEWAKDAHLSDYNFDSQHTSYGNILCPASFVATCHSCQ